MEKFILVLFLIIEIVFIIGSFIKNSNLKREKSVVFVSLFILFLVLIISPVIDWSMKWIMLSFVLGIQAIIGVLNIVKHKQNSPIKKGRIVLSGINRLILITMAFVPAIIFPQYKEIKATGNLSVNTVTHTIVDESREELFTEETNDKRKLTIQLWYPDAEGKYPLVVFSHGAFGFRMSNYSTYQELASNGYIVASIDHTYHAFMTKHDDGEVVIANMEFLNNAMGAQSGAITPEEIDLMEDEWMELRTADMSFVLDYIKNRVSSTSNKEVFNKIDIDHIGLFGHSLGGATSAQVGRFDNDIDAVIVVDGTMLGEEIENPPYPKPILNIYNESHYNEAINDDEYPNNFACRNAEESYEVVVKGSGHMNFTDLPMVSPFLSTLLETGDSANIDPRYCIETTNEVILEFFNHYLKNDQVEIAKERVY